VLVKLAGMSEAIADEILKEKRPRWYGHVGRVAGGGALGGSLGAGVGGVVGRHILWARPFDAFDGLKGFNSLVGRVIGGGMGTAAGTAGGVGLSVVRHMQHKKRVAELARKLRIGAAAAGLGAAGLGAYGLLRNRKEKHASAAIGAGIGAALHGPVGAAGGGGALGGHLADKKK
jgi:hypothetical protein